MIPSQCSALVPRSILCSSDSSSPAAGLGIALSSSGLCIPYPDSWTSHTAHQTLLSFRDLFLALWGGRRCLSCDPGTQCQLRFSQVTRGRGPYISYKCSHVTRAPACPLALPAPCQKLLSHFQQHRWNFDHIHFSLRGRVRYWTSVASAFSTLVQRGKRISGRMESTACH